MALKVPHSLGRRPAGVGRPPPPREAVGSLEWPSRDSTSDSLRPSGARGKAWNPSRRGVCVGLCRPPGRSNGEHGKCPQAARGPENAKAAHRHLGPHLPHDRGRAASPPDPGMLFGKLHSPRSHEPRTPGVQGGTQAPLFTVHNRKPPTA